MRQVIYRDNTWIPLSSFIRLKKEEQIQEKKIRFRTLGDITLTGGIISEAITIDQVIDELELSSNSERGNRADDKTSDFSMEDRKKEGYF